MDWRVIPEFENYEISRRGTVRSRTTKYALKKNGAWICLSMNGKRHHCRVSDLVTSAFEGAKEIDTTVTSRDLSELKAENERLRRELRELEAEVAAYHVHF